jgi:hypothetical protein
VARSRGILKLVPMLVMAVTPNVPQESGPAMPCLLKHRWCSNQTAQDSDLGWIPGCLGSWVLDYLHEFVLSASV